MNRDTLEGREKVLGQEHLDTLNSRVNQAVSEANQGRQKGAEELDVQLPETGKRLLEAGASRHADQHEQPSGGQNVNHSDTTMGL